MQSLQLVTPEQLVQSYYSFKYFHNNIFPLSFVGEKFEHGEHLNKWCDMLQGTPDVPHTCILAPREHSKSISIYSWLMWNDLRNMNRDYETLYISYTTDLAAYHIGKYKKLVDNNPVFSSMRDLKSNAEGIAKYTWNGKYEHTVEPAGILVFKRGRHPNAAILDDVLSDPTNMIDLAIIKKINRRVFEDVLSLPKRGGPIKAIGTAQTNADFFFQLKKNPRYNWGMFPAITNEKSKTVLWPQFWPYDRLMERKEDIREKAFLKEFMLKPVYSADTFFNTGQMKLIVNPALKSTRKLDTKNEVGAGWDIGKHSHPAHFAVFEFVPMGEGKTMAVERFDLWMDGWEYRKQLEHINALVETLRIDWVNFDNTRGEMEGFYEQNMMNKSVFYPVNFNIKTKSKMSSEFEKRVTNTNNEGNPAPTIMIQNNQRTIDQILAVTNDLQAIESHDGHGDSFFSISLALMGRQTGNMGILELDEDDPFGLK